MKVVDLVRAVVTDLHPEELPDFDRIIEVHRNDPAALALARTTVDEPTGSGITHAAEFFTSVVADVGVDLCATLLLTGVAAGVKRGRRLLSRRSSERAVTTETELPPVTEQQAAQIQAQAHELARVRGLPEADAAALAAALAATWTRL